MKSIDSILKSEFTRIARKEIACLLQPVKKEIALLKKAVLNAAAVRKGKRRKPRASSESRITPAQIRRIRKRLGLSQKAFARELGVSTGAVTGWESGRFRAKTATAAKIVSLKPSGKTGAGDSSATPASIRKVRKKCGLSQKDFAKKLKVSPGAVIAWEGGKFKPRKKMEEKIFSL